MRRVIYIDDREADLERYSPRLTFKGARVQPIRPTNNPIRDLAAAEKSSPRPDMFVLDYDLAHAKIEYRGTTLAGILRDKHPGVPIVLLTRKSLIENLDLRGVGELFDDVIFKSDLEADHSATRLTLSSLASGFERLRRVRARNWPSLLKLLEVPGNSDADLLLTAGPPFSNPVDDLRSSEGKLWSVGQAARWIRSVVLAYPGILYNDLHASTSLGISLDSFNRESVSKLFKPSLYRGIFSTTHRRWWRSGLFSIAAALVGSKGPLGPLTNTFRIAFRRKRHQSLQPSVCIYSRKGSCPAFS